MAEPSRRPHAVESWAVIAALACLAASPSAQAPTEKGRLGLDLTRITSAWTGDLDGMIERRMVRVLTAYSKTQYFVDRDPDALAGADRDPHAVAAGRPAAALDHEEELAEAGLVAADLAARLDTHVPEVGLAVPVGERSAGGAHAVVAEDRPGRDAPQVEELHGAAIHSAGVRATSPCTV